MENVKAYLKLQDLEEYWFKTIPYATLTSLLFQQCNQDIQYVIKEPSNSNECVCIFKDILTDKPIPVKGVEIKEQISDICLVVHGVICRLFNMYLERSDDKYVFNVPPILSEKMEKRIEIIKDAPQSAQRTKAWFEDRSKCITASIFGAILGMDHYKKKEEVIFDKCGQGKDFDGNKFTQHGTVYEDVVIQIQERHTGVKIGEYGMIKHYLLDLGASIDGMDEHGVGYEIKVPWSRAILKKNSEPGEKDKVDVPPHYWAQMQLQMECMNLDLCKFIQARIKEYCNRETYMYDEHPNKPGHTKKGFEKGAVLQWGSFKTKNVKFRYSPLGLSKTEIDNWCNTEIFNPPDSHVGEEAQIRWWYITEWHVVEVKRDKEWFKSITPIVGEVWDEIEYHRSNACFKIRQIKKEREIKKEHEIKKDQQKKVKKKQKKIYMDLL